MTFRPPTSQEIIRAIGPLEGADPALVKALNPGRDFRPISLPRPGDWLAEHPEPGQTFEAFERAKRNRPDPRRYKIYLQPIGSFSKNRQGFLETLADYARAFFATEVSLAPAMPVDKELTSRTNALTGKRQLLTRDILLMLESRLPWDAFCMLAVTMEDLYPRDSWNFVFGQASLTDRVGVFSFVRYDPAFYGETGGYRKLLRRSCKVMAHEAAHMFSIRHCVYFHCLMNGANHLAESDGKPMHLCPVCLRKLLSAVGFDFVRRYGNLLDVCRRNGFEDEAAWIAERLNALSRRGKET